MAYATVEQVEKGFRTLSESERNTAAALLDEAAVIIDAYNADATADAKCVVSCHMVRRVLSDGESVTAPMGATQGSMSALGYSQSWQLSTGSAGELYVSKLDRKLLGVGNAIGAASPVEGMMPGA